VLTGLGVWKTMGKEMGYNQLIPKTNQVRRERTGRYDFAGGVEEERKWEGSAVGRSGSEPWRVVTSEGRNVCEDGSLGGRNV